MTVMPPADPPVRAGSPFVTGRPLRADEPIFGREEAFRFLAGYLAGFSSVNLVGERRMGKTSLLTHLTAHQARYLPLAAGAPPLVLAHLTLQDQAVPDADHFYGEVLRQLLREQRAPELAGLRARLNVTPEARG